MNLFVKFFIKKPEDIFLSSPPPLFHLKAPQFFFSLLPLPFSPPLLENFDPLQRPLLKCPLESSPLRFLKIFTLSCLKIHRMHPSPISAQNRGILNIFILPVKPPQNPTPFYFAQICVLRRFLARDDKLCLPAQEIDSRAISERFRGGSSFLLSCRIPFSCKNWQNRDGKGARRALI